MNLQDRRGWLKLAHELPTRDERELAYSPAFWAGGGSSAFDRRLFLGLGGFDGLYDPFYMEDTDLSYQAWKRGYDVLFTSRASVWHEHRGTSRKVFGDDFVDNMIRRNQHLFLWRSVTDLALAIPILALLPLTCLARAQRPGTSLAAGLWFELRALGKALPRLPQALWKRCRARRFYMRSDREVLQLSASVRRYRDADRADLGALPAPQSGGLRILVMSARMPNWLSPLSVRTNAAVPGSSVVTSTRNGAKSSATRCQTSCTTSCSGAEKAALSSRSRPA